MEKIPGLDGPIIHNTEGDAAPDALERAHIRDHLISKYLPTTKEAQAKIELMVDEEMERRKKKTTNATKMVPLPARNNPEKKKAA